MKRNLFRAVTGILLVLIFCLGGSSLAFAGEIVEPSTAKILINGTPRSFEVYNLNQHNYFKLRDLACALQGTPKNFNIAWNQEQNAILLSSNQPYQGSVEPPGRGRIKIAEANNATVLLDGKSVPLASLKIEDESYFRLKDVMQALNIYMDWSESTQTILLDTAHPFIAPAALPLAGRVICIDPGHGTFSKAYAEPLAPYATQTQPAFVAGTAGAQASEAEVNLAVGLLLQEKLKAQGAQVLMTRTGTAATLSNVERAKLANNAQADLVMRIHCDSNDSASISGLSMLVPGGKYVDYQIVQTSREIGTQVLNSTLQATSAANRGVVVRNDLSGFNWSTVPTILLEMGCMSNPTEDQKLCTASYQQQLAEGISTGIAAYFQTQPLPAAPITLPKSTAPIAQRVDKYLQKNRGISQQTALWRVKMNLDQPEFTQAQVLTSAELSSLAVVVNKRHRVPNNYIPADLVKINDRVSLRAPAKTAFDSMVAAAKSQGYRITPVSGFRTVKYQKNLHNRYLKTDSQAVVDTYSARAGFSEHHTGLAVDVNGSNNNMSNFGASKESAWVAKNAYKYGFIVRYLPEAQSITGYKSEPWHLRYVGTELATAMHAQGIKTLEEYVGRFLI